MIWQVAINLINVQAEEIASAATILSSNEVSQILFNVITDNVIGCLL
jgi:hypothetical protein